MGELMDISEEDMPRVRKIMANAKFAMRTITIARKRKLRCAGCRTRRVLTGSAFPTEVRSKVVMFQAYALCESCLGTPGMNGRVEEKFKRGELSPSLFQAEG